MKGLRARVLLFLATLPAASDVSAQRSGTIIIPCVSVQAQADSDQDGLADECEAGLARAFAPTLVVRAGGCNWDASAIPARLGGGYRFAVQRVDSLVRIAYLPAYFQDCGWKGVKCWLPGINCDPHAGDSEFIAVDVRDDSASVRWSVRGVFLSAHCFGRSDDDCRWYRGADLARFEWDDGPVVWVAEGRQANYPNEAACDRGHHSIDSCDDHDARYRFPVDSTANIGSRLHPRAANGCEAGRALNTSRVDAQAIECFWDRDTPFRGWQDAARGVTGYWRYLTGIAEF